MPVPNDLERNAKQSGTPKGAYSTSSYATIFRSTVVIGGASVICMALGVVRNKAVSLVVGPSGIGLLGLLNTLMNAAVTISQMGLGTVGTRQIAEANSNGDSVRLANATWALMIATAVLSLIGGVSIWMLRRPLAIYVLGNPDLAWAVGWSGLGVGLAVAALGQSALINGLRRIKDLALLQIAGGVTMTLIGLPMVWWFGEVAIPYYVVVLPLSSFLIGHFVVSRIPKRSTTSLSIAEMWGQWRVFGSLGLPVTAAAILTTSATLWIQTDIRNQLGLEAIGFYTASSVIAVQYVGLVLGAIGADYYPRLTGVIQDQAAARQMVNQQTEVALVIAGPLIILMFVLAPWIITLLYSEAFTPATDVLRWQVVGTLLKVVSFPLAFVLRAEGSGGLYFVTEALTVATMVGATTVGLDYFGLIGAGIGFFIAYAVYVPVLLVTAGPRISFAWSKPVMQMLGSLTLCLLTLCWPVMFLSQLSVAVGTVIGFATMAYFAIELNRRLPLTEILNRTKK